MDKITVKYGLLKQVVNALDKKGFNDDSDVSFEYIVGSCFPDILKNIKDRIRLAHMQGYTQKLEDEGIEYIRVKNSKEVNEN